MIHPEEKNQHIFDRFWFEPLLLFAVLYLPGYLSQTSDYNRSLFDSLSFNLLYIIITLPQILLILYLIRKRETWYPEQYGIRPLTLRDIGSAFLILLCIYIVIVPLMILLRQGSVSDTTLLQESGWRISRPLMLPVILCTCMLTGYSEELFFRAYLLTVLERQGIRPLVTVCITVLLFSTGHLYQGFESFLGTAGIGFILAVFFLKYRNLHRIGIAHGLYNFFVLLLSLFFPVAI